MKRFLLIALVMYAGLDAWSQDPSIDAGPDMDVCPPECVTITAEYEGGGGNTSDYETEAIDFAPDPYAGIAVTLFDDDVTDAIPIGFDFCFYGNTYSQMYIGSNGWVSFSPGEPTTFTSSPIPSAAADVPKNCIMGPWYDINPGSGGEIRYQVLGAAPVRRMVISYINIPHFLCDDQIETYQIILYETSNEIENHLEEKDICFGWDDGFAVQGLHNEDGTEAVVFPGRNNTAWGTTDDAIRYTPLGEPTIEWYDEDGTLVAEGAEATLCPDVPTTYTVRLFSCGVEIASDEVFIDVICCEPPTMSHTDIACFGECTGTATAEPFGVPPFTYTWDAATGGQTTATAVGLCAGTYSVTVSDSEGCIQEGTVTIEEPEELVVTIDATDITCAGASDGSIVITATGGTDPLTYDIGTGPSVTGTFTDLSVGNYPVSVTDANGCEFTTNVILEDSPLPDVSFSADIVSGCEPITVVFTNTGDGGTSCEWDFGDGTSAIGCGDVTHTYENFGVYDVSLRVTAAGGCFSEVTYTSFIEVFEVPDANFFFSPTNITTLDTEVSFTDLSSTGNSWQWEIADLSTSSEQNPEFTFPSEEGLYPVTLTVTTENGCTDEITKTVEVNQVQLIFAPNAFTPDGDTFNETFLPYFTGIDIYDFHLLIFNRWGEVVFESFNPAVGWNGTYGGEIVQDGTYIWQISVKDIATDKRNEFFGHVTVMR